MAHGGPPNQIPEITSYSVLVARQPKPSKGPRPQQGARLLALRKASGLTQIELAKALDVPQANIAFWEWSDKPPRSDLLSKMAKAFGVKLEDLLLSSERPIAKRKGPIGEMQRTFEAVTKLPRKQQRKVLEMVQALVEQYKRKAS